MEIERLYGAPTKISTQLRPECRAEAAAACLESRDSELLSMWFWGERGVVGVRLTAHKGQIGLLIDYKNEQKMKQ